MAKHGLPGIRITKRGCWEWTGSRYKTGYGKRVILGEVWLTHRWAWECESGPIPKGLHALHDCDNRPCINDAHLFLGTQADNNNDRHAKGRTRWRATSLTRRQARHVQSRRRWKYGDKIALAERWDVPVQAIYDVTIGKTWVLTCA